MGNEKAKFTPGPYGIYENEETAFLVITRPDKDGIRIVGLAVKDPEAKRQGELEATAALFKAAPELLAALEGLVNGRDVNDYKAYEAARAAIAKARGGK